MLAHYFHSFQTSEKAILPTATIILLIQPLWSLFKCINIRDFLFEHFSIGFFLFFRTKKTSKVGDTEKNGKIPNKNWEKGRDRNKRENYFKKFIQWGLPCLHTKWISRHLTIKNSMEKWLIDVINCLQTHFLSVQNPNED